MIQRLAKPVFLFVILIFIFVSVALILGEEQERKVWAETPSTLHLYSTETVCQDESTGNVLNCGQCGSCSNIHDIRIYDETRSTQTETMTDCAFGDLLFDDDAFDCLKERVGMTDGCAKCWVLNYHCNKDNCLRTCVKHRFFPFLPSLNSWEGSGPLDPCIACDEKLCGPLFVGCAGANRRRAGVVSDLDRDMDREMCGKVDLDWIRKIASASSREQVNANEQASGHGIGSTEETSTAESSSDTAKKSASEL
jgi:hypothetical protein